MILKIILIFFLSLSIVITSISIYRLAREKDEKVSTSQYLIILATAILAFIEARILWKKRENQNKNKLEN